MTLDDYLDMFTPESMIRRDEIDEIIELLDDTQAEGINPGMFPSTGTSRYSSDVINMIRMSIDMAKNVDVDKTCGLMDKEFAKLNIDNVNNLMHAVMTVKLAGRFDKPVDVLKDDIGVTTLFGDLTGYEDYVDDIIKSKWLSETFNKLCVSGWDIIKYVPKQTVNEMTKFIMIINKLSNSMNEETI